MKAQAPKSSEKSRMDEHVEMTSVETSYTHDDESRNGMATWHPLRFWVSSPVAAQPVEHVGRARKSEKAKQECSLPIEVPQLT